MCLLIKYERDCNIESPSKQHYYGAMRSLSKDFAFAMVLRRAFMPPFPPPRVSSSSLPKIAVARSKKPYARNKPSSSPRRLLIRNSTGRPRSASIFSRWLVTISINMSVCRLPESEDRINDGLVQGERAETAYGLNNC